MKSILIFFCFLVLSFGANAKSGDQIRYLPVQDSGRIKPFDTFAKETLEIIYGKKSYKPDQNAKPIEAHWVVLTWMLAPESWVNRPLFEVTYFEVLEKLDLEKGKKYYTGEELFKTEKFGNLMQELANKKESKEKLTPYFQALQRLENQFYVFREIASGRLLAVLPRPDATQWFSVSELPIEIQPYFLEISKNVATFLGATAEGKNIEEAGQSLDQAVIKFQDAARRFNPEKYEAARKTKTEVIYNKIHPFRWAYVFYLLAVLTLLYIWIRKMSGGMGLAWTFVSIGFLIHTLGFGFRVYLAERPPVSNMYETVIWASWGAILFSMILEKVYKFRILLLGGSLVGLVSLIVADVAPAVLDPSIQPLEAVLRSNYWLIVHVMTITISYAAFMLAFGLGDLGMVYYVMGREKHDDTIQKLTTGVYRSIQIGVAFLAPGIILGGIWADYSWGRFWGWDPKETWALIVLLGYIIVLHARLVGWLKNFGMLASGIITFSLVIMAWYGVNFVLGAGLHSYGFGAGGVEYVSIFVLLHMMFVIYAYLSQKSQKTNS
ncbi:MAG: cytochrome C biogenesis protein [Bdellovibrionales bacterium RIFCSPHIGHO2_01_FULL_40_29]|nr:MAG: cytochrome C biogenesis protein [Bdellovibrionales bacterium RIFCSPHIGHO2_01_FULL_40_29]OFZ34604.1 MAG: cytochrome C biogenesis protein [Bdellovibrionales bacterium RIFCSPHIGHO2_02_FULL_40_15]